MRNVYLIAQRELRGFFLGFYGYLILAAYLLASGLLFNLFAVGDREKFSRQVLEDYFFQTSGLVMIMAVLLAMRLIAEEKQTQSFVLLRTSPVSEREIVLGKFLSAVAVLAISLAASAYLPALILVNGKISFSHVAVGYLGLLLLGAASIAIALLASVWFSSQFMAGAVGGLMIAVLLVAWMAGRVSDAPLKELLTYVALHNLHFRTFSNGIPHVRDVVYYLGVTLFFLECAARSLESWKWRP